MLYDGAMVVYHVICTCLGAEFGLPRRVYFHFHEYDRVAHLLCGSIYNTSTFVFFFETDSQVKPCSCIKCLYMLAICTFLSNIFYAASRLDKVN
jgi:hypothetical protein